MIHLAATIFVVICVLAVWPLIAGGFIALLVLGGIWMYIDYLLSPGIAPFWVWWVNINLVICVILGTAMAIKEKFFSK